MFMIRCIFIGMLGMGVGLHTGVRRMHVTRRERRRA